MGDVDTNSGNEPEKPLAEPIGSSNQEEPPITDPEGPRHPGARKLASITAIILLLSFGAYQLRFTIASIVSPKLYTQYAWRNTERALSKELLSMASGNAVVKRALGILKDSSIQELNIDLKPYGKMSLLLANDIRGNKAQALLEREAGEAMSVYLSDTVTGLRLGDGYYMIKPSQASKEVTQFFQANGISNEVPDLDLTYAAVKQSLVSRNVAPVSQDLDRTGMAFLAIIEKLYNVASYEKNPKTVLRLGDKDVSCKTITLSVSREDAENGLNQLADAFENDMALFGISGGLSWDWAEVLREQALFYNGPMRVTLYAYKNAFVKITLENLESGTFFSVSTLGKDHRLDAISLASNGRNKFSFQAMGDHIGPGPFRTTITAESVGPLSRLDSVSIVWQPDGQRDNLIIGKGGRIQKKLTLGINKDEIVLESPEKGVLWTLAPLGSRLEWPQDAKPLKELNLADVHWW
ncbi:MAG: hypothetical protein LBC41_14355, partial [Clostridiales bacterium]|nr:hypothetical protein [Clostridiales bacterium]